MRYHAVNIAAMLMVLFMMRAASEVTEQPDETKGGSPAVKNPAPKKTATRKNLKMPGLVINLEKRCVDVEGVVSLDEGMLELVACTRGGKDHESIITLLARPLHIHTALIALGARNGNPAMHRQVGEQDKRWVYVPPRGDPIEVYLVLKNKEGKDVEHPISDFVSRTENGYDGGDGDEDGEVERFPHTFLFAGSQLVKNEQGKHQYLADLSGNVISISTFGDEVLCLPGTHSKENGALVWEVNAKKLPKVGSNVILRLRPEDNSDLKLHKASSKNN